MNNTVIALSVERGTSRSLGLKITDRIEVSSLAPDGKHIAFTAGAGNREVWVIENLLSPTGDARCFCNQEPCILTSDSVDMRNR